MKPWHIITGIVLLIVGLVWFLVWEDGEWQRYKREHNCQLTMDQRWIPIQVCNSTGKTMICVPVMTEQHRWTCDDGTAHWRSDDNE